jgi:hypothetical protein
MLCTGVVVNKRRRTHQIIDYAVVPVFGCEVRVTVNEIVTNAWLVCTLWLDSCIAGFA